MKKILVILLMLVSTLLFADNSKKNILVVESYSSDYQWDISYKEGLESVLEEVASLEYFEMNTKKLPKTEHPKMAEAAWNKYISSNPDLVILADDAALKYLGEKMAATKTPTIYLGINNNPRNYFKEIPQNITGVLERPIIKRSISYIKEIYPKAKKGLILFDSDITAEIVKKDLFYDKDSLEFSGIINDIKMIGLLDDWKKEINSVQGKYDFIVLGLFQTIKDDKGNSVLPDVIAKWTSENSKVPIFGLWDFSIGKDAAIGGLVLFGKDMGIEVGKMTLEVLSGKDIKTIRPVTNNQGVFLFSKTQLEKWKINLPEEIKSKSKIID